MINPAEFIFMLIPAMIGTAIGTLVTLLIHRDIRPKTIGGYIVAVHFSIWHNRNTYLYFFAAMTVYLYVWTYMVGRETLTASGAGLSIVGLCSVISIPVALTIWNARESKDFLQLVRIWGSFCSIFWAGYIIAVKLLT